MFDTNCVSTYITFVCNITLYYYFNEAAAGYSGVQESSDS